MSAYTHFTNAGYTVVRGPKGRYWFLGVTVLELTAGRCRVTAPAARAALDAVLDGLSTLSPVALHWHPREYVVR